MRATTGSRSPASTSCLYLGSVMHKRLRPFAHGFRYRVFSLCLDLDELPALDARLRLFSHNRGNLFAFYDRDHGPRDGTPLRPWIEGYLRQAGIDLAGGRVRLLCFPRILGYVFTPLSIWFCHHADGRLLAVLYEVHNTFGERHGYLIPVRPGNPGAPIAQAAEKRFHVSPFIGMTARYRFLLKAPDERLAIVIRQWVPDGEQLVARHSGRRAALTDGTLLRVFTAYPLMTFKVIAAIHWQALRLWLRGAKVQPRPAPPPQDVTLVRTGLANAER